MKFSPSEKQLFWKENIKGQSQELKEQIIVEMVLKSKLWEVFELLDMGVSVQTKGRIGEGPLQSLLHIAVETGSPLTAQMLLGKGAKTEILDAVGTLPLVTAVDEGNVRMVEVLLNGGANPRNGEDARGSAMELARNEGKVEILALLQEYAEQHRKPGSGPKVGGLN